ncbi:thiolase family protein [Nocardia huaxiensis]|uniref:Thiolase family protein n=1 Tax=Nocardia huaxiensis TaxID=2755382 RepID=A0A7D6Z7I0_9NOCA|nr:thiolase family protein [Nocardia huaxiensis]QLY28848.1 thiolase family protein [Nocardia huaxiensis]UFS97676.1 thiolase family protein [Nocardia huaxiensis]
MATRAMIAGVGSTPATSPRKQERSALELVQEAVWAALAHSGAAPNSLDGIVIGNIDGFEGTVLGAKHLVRRLGLGADLPVSIVNTGGTTGGNLMQLAARQVRSGDRRRVLCVGGPTFYGAEDLQSAINTNSPMIVEQPLGMGAYHMGAFYPSAYQQRFGATVEDFAVSVVQAHEHASRNPYAHLRDTLTVADVVASKPLSHPMTMAMVCPVSTSANALLVTSEQSAVELRPTPVLIRAMATSSDPYLGGGKNDFAAMENLSILARKVYRIADIRNPREDIDVVELFAPYAPMQPMQLEALGFAPPGGGIDLIRSGATGFDGDLPTNLSGGPLCTNAGVAGELAPYVYVALQLMGDAPEEMQVAGARRGLAHGTGGTFFQFENLAILERQERP